MTKRELIELAREMRRTPTRSEQIFWDAVRDRQLDGVKFRRQQVIERFVVDFFVPSHRLVVEIDGGVHRGREEHDALREQFLEDCGLRVLRFSADDVERRLPEVLDTLLETLNSLTPGTASLTPGTASLTPGPASLTPGTASLTPGTASLTPGTASLTPGPSPAGGEGSCGEHLLHPPRHLLERGTEGVRLDRDRGGEA